MTPESIGLTQSDLVLGKHSGRHAFQKRLQGLGLRLDRDQVNRAFEKFKELCDKKKQVFDEDLLAIVDQEIVTVPEIFSLEYINTNSGSSTVPTATVILRRENQAFQDSSTGDGPVDAAYRAIDRITGLPGRLAEYNIRAVTSGKDALGEANIKVRFEDVEIAARAASTDVIEASVRAYLVAVNKMLAARTVKKGRKKASGKTKPKGF